MKKLLATLLLATALAACGGESSNSAENKPQPQAISDDAKGYYCTMNLPEHNGPKAQIFLESKPDEALWFSTVTQIFNFVRHPGEPKDIAAIYVTDMSDATDADWEKPLTTNAKWIDARTAHYVIESRYIGGMGTQDAIPFSDMAKAQEFVNKNGGRIVKFDDVPDSFIYANPVLGTAAQTGNPASASAAPSSASAPVHNHAMPPAASANH